MSYCRAGKMEGLVSIILCVIKGVKFQQQLNLHEYLTDSHA